MKPVSSPQDSRSVNDAELIQRVQAREASAFELLMRRHNRRLYRIAYSFLRDHAESEDALQDAYLAAFRSAERFRGEASLSTWLTRIVANECMTRMRRSARRNNIVPIVQAAVFSEEDEPMPEKDAGNEQETPDRQMLRSELRALLERRIEALPFDFRVVFMMRAVEDLSVEETAQCLGIPDATVRSRLFRARSLLRESIAQDLDLAERDVFDFAGERCDRVVARVMKAI
ncbi:RNA polymerase sigma factor [Ramlibacter solisilvae]|uniref:RNA polymerase sigma factor n=1 Tax=Ramlibacter tataouinensis TaxID=94132 RepID=A0A127JYG1_9BURK|nr:RNA polymerase sigma factor [Ramlibacter tataouinensis]AMO25017.1 RNA polymerase sigma factor [Ramlibacter tataouinensis]